MRAQTSIMPQRQNFAQSKVRFTEGISLVKRPTRNRFEPYSYPNRVEVSIAESAIVLWRPF